MIQNEIANAIFSSGKYIKQCFLTELGRYYAGSSDSSPDFTQYMQMLEQLHTLYHSLGSGLESPDRLIQEAADSVPFPAGKGAVESFGRKYISALNCILVNTLRFRRCYCCIQRNDIIPGIGSHMITNLGQIITSLNDGYIPVIDTSNANNIFTEISRNHGKNAWELYFRQPLSAGLQDVPAGEVKRLDGIPGFMPSYNMDCLMNPELISFWREAVRKYMPFSPELEAKIQDALSSLPFNGDTRILGILCRGTDYTGTRPYNHPSQPPVEIILSEAEEAMYRYQCDYCYLATEDQQILKRFQDRFQNKLLTTQEIYYPSDLNNALNQSGINSHIDIHQKNMEYLTALALLSKCQLLIGGRTSGIVVSILLSDGFEHTHIWDNGRYGIDDAFTLASHIL